MNKAQNILHRTTENYPVANLQIDCSYWSEDRYSVEVSKRGEERFFKCARAGLRSPLSPEVTIREVTESFLSVEGVDAAIKFLELHGPIVQTHDPPFRKIFAEASSYTLKWSYFRAMQALIRSAWEGDFSQKVQEWAYYIDFNIFYYDLGKPPKLNTHLDGPVQALTADIVFSQLRGLPTAFCQRHDCRRLFTKESKHERKYCSVECAHLESVRRHRERKAKPSKLRK